MHLVDAPILFRTHMHTHWLWVRLERFSVATTSGHRLFPPLFFFPYRIPLLSSREYFTLQVNHVTRSRRRRQRTRHSSAEKYTRRRKAALAHTDTHTHTRPPRRHALKTKSSASRCSPRSQMRGQIVFFFFLSSYSYTYTYVPLCRARRRSELSRSQSSCARASGLRNAGSKLIARCTTRFAVYAAAAIHICPEQQQLFYSQAARRSLSPERRGIVDAEARLGLVTGPCRGLIVRC